jgi:hypothetical protein
MIVVVGLQTAQPGRRQLHDQLIRDDAAALRRARVREHRDPAGGPHQRERREHVEIRLRDAVPRAQPLGGERGRHRRHQAEPHQPLRQVRSADAATPGRGEDLVPVQVDAVGTEQVDHPPGPRLARVAHPRQFGRQLRMGRVEEVGEHVQPDRRLRAEPAAGQLGARHQRQAGRQGRFRFRPAGGRVVIGERHHVQPARGGGPDQVGRGQRAVARRGVGVQVDAHPLDVTG